ncbi:lysine exporter LysO family protein [Ewingella americana]|uniref:Lysine exporter LysO family protein n=1 Tax=Ewingella americana TaxID=41202 RepID=A0A502G212_9GAMM|nr:lysine exporter LysO family protein [Ewingella americana]TPG55849.1 lysine exporter LysO family protein [Ewingella americana]
MLIALYSLLPILLAFAGGLNLKKVVKNIRPSTFDIISTLSLYLLLLIMGATVGGIPDIKEQLVVAGFNALTIASGTSLATFIVLVAVDKLSGEKRPPRTAPDLRNSRSDILSILLPTLTQIITTAGGFILGFKGLMPDLDADLIISFLLYLLIFSVAVKLSYSNISMKRVLLNKANLRLTLITILSSFTGAALASLFIKVHLHEVLAVGSGFGWYTLSGTLFTKMGNPLLGTVAFLSDLFRGISALVLIPLISRFGYSNAAIGISGSTALDVTLPIIEKYCGAAYIPFALLMGGITTLAVPFAIPFFYYL